MTVPLRIDFVSDISCPWCVIGLGGLEQALTALDGVIEAEIYLQPFELNPDMPAEGQAMADYYAAKGLDPERMAASREVLSARAADLGFRMNGRSRVYNTFDAHRLLHWAEPQGRHLALKRALFEAYFTDGQDPSDPDTLSALAVKAGLDGEAARDVLASGRYGDDVRAAEHQWRAAGVNSVPAIIINQRYLISGGQPAEVFEDALRRIAAEAA